jgi:hypothetical protein
MIGESSQQLEGPEKNFLGRIWPLYLRDVVGQLPV